MNKTKRLKQFFDGYFRENAKSKQNKAVKELGAAGTPIFGGQIFEEYNTLINNNLKRCELYEQMLADASVYTSFKTAKLPITSAKFDISPGGKTVKDKFIADFVYHVLFESMDLTFKQLIGDICYSMAYGYVPFEIIEKAEKYNYNNRNYSMVKYKKIAFRHPKTVEKWEFNEESNIFEGLWQRIPSNNKLVYIPMENMIVFTYEKVGDNIEGRSLLRPVIKNWKYKEAFYKIEGIGIERNAVGIPILYLSNPTDEEVAKGKKLVRSVVVHEEMGFVLEKDFNEFDFKSGGIDSVAIHKAIAHHDSKIFLAVFAGFLNLGQESRGGGRALGESLIQFFLMGIQGYLDNITEMINNVLIKRIVDKNFTGVKNYPKLTANLGTIGDKQIWANIFKAMFKGGLMLKHDIKQVQDVYNKLGVEYNEDVVDSYVADNAKDYKESRKENKALKEPEKT